MELDVAQSIVLRPDEGEVISDRAERTVRIKVGLDAIAVTETRYEPGEPGPDPHIHRGHTDAFYVLEGTLDVKLGPERKTTRLPASSFVAAPPNLVHSFKNEGPGRARFLNFHAPSGGFADYLRAMRDGEDGSWFDQIELPAGGGRPLSDAAVLRPAEGERIAVGGSSLDLKGTAASSDGTFFLSETTVEPGFPGPPPHVHRELHDLFYVLEGTLALRVGGETVPPRRARSRAFRPARCTRSRTRAANPSESSTSRRRRAGRATCASSARRSGAAVLQRPRSSAGSLRSTTSSSRRAKRAPPSVTGPSPRGSGEK